MSRLYHALSILLAVKFSHGALLLWSSKALHIPALKRFDNSDLNAVLRETNSTQILTFRAKTVSAARHVDGALKNLQTAYMLNAELDVDNAEVSELTGDRSLDISIIQDALKDVQNGTLDNTLVALIIEDASRTKRKVESGIASVDDSEVPYAEPSDDPILYSAAVPGNKDVEAMIYSSKPPLLRMSNYSLYLGPATLSRMDRRDTYTRLIATIPVENGKIILRFKFPWTNGYWFLTSVEMIDENAKQFNLTLNQDVTAPRQFSYHCGGQIVFTDPDNRIDLFLYNVQAQPDAFRHRFGDAYNCVPFTTGPLWSGLFVTFMLLIGLAIGISAISSIKTMDKFDNHKTKQLSITIWE